jgi:hypothetical protein
MIQRTNGVFDPFKNPYDVRNLNPEIFRQSKFDLTTNELANKIKEIVDTEMVASIPNSVLDELYVDVALDAAFEYTWQIQNSDGAHWISLCLCMLSHSLKWVEGDATKFQKSPVDGLPLYGKNVEFVDDVLDKRRSNLVSKIRVPEEPVKELPEQFSLF